MICRPLSFVGAPGAERYIPHVAISSGSTLSGSAAEGLALIAAADFGMPRRRRWPDTRGRTAAEDPFNLFVNG